jgi:mono/diheme cytochrome c family protein
MNRVLSTIAAALLAGCFGLLWGAQPTSQGRQSPQAQNNTSGGKAGVDPVAKGEKLFQVNCGRCHNAPEQLSPRAAETVLRHMKVRALLSETDEKLILEYLRP